MQRAAMVSISLLASVPAPAVPGGGPEVGSVPKYRLEAGDLTVDLAIGSPHLRPEFGPRFDETAIVTRLAWRGRELLDPRGLPDEFGLNGSGVLGYDEAGLDGTFLKIGVGVIRRDSERPYQFWRPYPVVETFPVAIREGTGGVSVEQSGSLRDWAYRYRKSYRLSPDGVLTVDYELMNTGSKAWPFEHYNHHFLRFDGAVSDGAYAIHPAFAMPGSPPEAWTRDEAGIIRLAAPVPAKRGVYWGEELAVGAELNRVRVSHANGLWLEMTGDAVPARFAIWSDPAALCPEIFFRAELAPGGTARWLRSFRVGAEP